MGKRGFQKLLFYCGFSDPSSFIYFFAIPVTIKAIAPLPVTLHAVPKLSCSAKIESTIATPAWSKPNTLVISPNDAITVPPGTPGAATPNKSNKNINVIICVREGIVPYSIWEAAITKKVSVNTEPHR